MRYSKEKIENAVNEFKSVTGRTASIYKISTKIRISLDGGISRPLGEAMHDMRCAVYKVNLDKEKLAKEKLAKENF